MLAPSVLFAVFGLAVVVIATIDQVWTFEGVKLLRMNFGLLPTNGYCAFAGSCTLHKFSELTLAKIFATDSGKGGNS